MRVKPIRGGHILICVIRNSNAERMEKERMTRREAVRGGLRKKLRRELKKRKTEGERDGGGGGSERRI